MKTVLAIILALSASSAVAAPIEANVFNCKGQDLEITMTTGGRPQGPSLTLGNPTADSPVAILSQPHQRETEMGLGVTGFYPYIADATLAYTLIVPRVIVKNQSVTGINGMVVRSLSGGFFAPGEPAPGPVQHNTFTPVVCVAHLSFAL